MTLKFSRADQERLEPVLDAIGAMAVAHKSEITLKALPANEIDILKQILAGRQKGIKVRSTPVADDSVELSVFLSQR